LGIGVWEVAMGLALVVVMQLAIGHGIGHGWRGGHVALLLGLIGVCMY